MAKYKKILGVDTDATKYFFPLKLQKGLTHFPMSCLIRLLELKVL